MFLQKIKIEQIIITALCLITLIGFFLPAINISIDFMGRETSISLSMRSLFERSESRFGGADLSQADLFNLGGDNMFSDIIADVSGIIVRSVGAYIITLILLIVILVLTLFNKIPKITMGMSAVSLGLFIYAGNTVLTAKEALVVGLESSLGFLAMFLNISEMIFITLGNGYRMTLIMLVCLLLAKIVFFIIDLKQKKSQDIAVAV